MLPDGGQRFIFLYPIRDYCHACEIVGYAEVAFDFDASGNFLGPRLLSLYEADGEPTYPQYEPVPTPVAGSDGMVLNTKENGEWIAYIGLDNNIWMISIISGDNIQITSDATDPFNDNTLDIDYLNSILKWSPDGGNLAFVQEDYEYTEEIYSTNLWIYNLRSRKSKLIIEGIGPRWYDWKPDSVSIAYSPPIYLAVLDFDNIGGDVAGIWEVNVNSGITSELVPPLGG